MLKFALLLSFLILITVFALVPMGRRSMVQGAGGREGKAHLVSLHIGKEQNMGWPLFRVVAVRQPGPRSLH
jgi:hypothetical protein